MNRFSKGFFCTFALSVLVGCAGSHPRLKVGEAPNGEVVEAEGLVPNLPNDLPATKAAALAAAQRSAVEKVVGVYISAKTRVEKSVLLDSKILADSSGYISKYDILSEGPEGAFYKTKIRALVLLKKIGDDLQNLGLMTPEMGNPRVVVLLEESVDGKASDKLDASNALMASLIKRGFIIVDRSAMAGAATQKIIEAINQGDARAATDLGQKVNAEVVITGQANSNDNGYTSAELGGMSSYRARVSIQAVRSGTGQMLSAGSEEAGGLHIQKPLAAAKAMETAGGMVGDRLATDLTAALRDQFIDVNVHRAKDLAQLKSLQDSLGGVPDVKGVFLRNYAQGEGLLSVSGSGISADKISHALSSNSGLQVTGVSASGLDVTFAP